MVSWVEKFGEWRKEYSQDPELERDNKLKVVNDNMSELADKLDLYLLSMIDGGKIKTREDFEIETDFQNTKVDHEKKQMYAQFFMKSEIEANLKTRSETRQKENPKPRLGREWKERLTTLIAELEEEERNADASAGINVSGTLGSCDFVVVSAVATGN